jgi:hypothetical protein
VPEQTLGKRNERNSTWMDTIVQPERKKHFLMCLKRKKCKQRRKNGKNMSALEEIEGARRKKSNRREREREADPL